MTSGGCGGRENTTVNDVFPREHLRLRTCRRKRPDQGAANHLGASRYGECRFNLHLPRQEISEAALQAASSSLLACRFKFVSANDGLSTGESQVRRLGTQHLIRLLEGSSVFVILIILWQLAVWVFHPAAYLLPAPETVWYDIWNPALRWPRSIAVTAQEILGGFCISALVGVGLGNAIAWTPALERTILPFLVAFNILPKVAIAPLFVIYLGYGIFPNMVIAAMIGFFPVVINTATGLAGVDPDWIDLARSLGAPKWKVFLRVRIPQALPHIVSGLKVSSTLVVVGAVIGEFIASQDGLGNVEISTQVSLNTSVAFASLFWLSTIGLLLYWAIDLVAKISMPWARDTIE
jgi:NitT/TauT family transport system permease protein